MQWILATGNEGKRREFGVLLSELPFEVELASLASWPETIPEVIEDRETFRGNAIKKALEVSQHTGMSALADDSGLEVDALDGRPGVYSARFSDEGTDDANNAKLVASLSGIGLEDRTARYVAVVALVLTAKDHRELFGAEVAELPEGSIDSDDGGWFRIGDRAVVVTRGTCEGLIVDEARGDGGFGYDPHFYVPDWDARMAEVSLDKKNERSHRARAVRELDAAITARLPA